MTEEIKKVTKIAPGGVARGGLDVRIWGSMLPPVIVGGLGMLMLAGSRADPMAALLGIANLALAGWMAVIRLDRR